MYKHRTTDSLPIDLPAGKVVCVGRNYHDHIKEMASSVTRHPMLFMKPQNALCDFSGDIAIPTHHGECHNEIEVALLVKEKIDRHSKIDMAEQIWGIGLGLDLTLRDIQREAKEKGHPWESSKSFDNSCPVSEFVPFDQVSLPLNFSLQINDVERQAGRTSDMIFDMPSLLAAIASVFTLLPGDIVLTGTPAGVGPLYPNDRLEATLEGYLSTRARVIPWR